MDVLAFLEAHGAIRRGLTVFRNGLVSDGWIEKGEVFRDPNALEVMAEAQAQAIARHFPTTTLITGIPACGAVLASAVARHLHLPVAFPIPSCKTRRSGTACTSQRRDTGSSTWTT